MSSNSPISGKRSRSRRQFLKQLGAAGFASTLPVSKLLAASSSTTKPAAIKNRAPLASNAFYPLPLDTIKPSGWLRAQLVLQGNSLSGHLDETWPDVGPDSGWLGGKGESWERGPYYLDGLVALAMAVGVAQQMRPVDVSTLIA